MCRAKEPEMRTLAPTVS